VSAGCHEIRSCLLALTTTAVMFRGADRSNLSSFDIAAPSVHLDLAYWRSYVMSKQLPSAGIARARVTSASFYVRPTAAAATRLAWLVSGVAGRPRHHQQAGASLSLWFTVYPASRTTRDDHVKPATHYEAQPGLISSAAD